jgi:DNA-binding Lrp family transcriptional regulator
MTFVSLNHDKLDQQKKAKQKKSAGFDLKKVLHHPVRLRVLGILKGRRGQTQRELGKALYMSNAAVHYHLQMLLKSGLVVLCGTRPGPNGITEKLYAVDTAAWQAALEAPGNDADLGFYLHYAVSWMHEHHREGIQRLESGDVLPPFMVGSYSVIASQDEILAFKRDLHDRVKHFYEKHKDCRSAKKMPVGVTFAILPSHAESVEESQNMLEYEPDQN